MGGTGSGIYLFGGFRMEAEKRLLLRGGNPVPLTPKVFDTLLHLVQRKGEVVEKEQLMKAVWPDTIVEENNLSQNISTLRRVLGQDQTNHRYILTVPGRGYQFVAELVGSPSESTRPSVRVTLAVLPFDNLGAGSARDYLADGLTEETIAALGQVDPEHFSVIGRTSVMNYKGTSKTLAEIGRELNAPYLIESSIRAEGERLRITSKLVRASDQIQIWSASYDSEPSSMLVFQQELSAAIAQQVQLQLSPERISALARRQTRNAEAYDLYLRGRHYWHQLSVPTTKRAIESFTKATELDPEYALAWSGIADTLAATPINGDAPTLAIWPRAKEAAARAVRAEPNLSEAQASLGFVKFWLDWDWLGAEKAFRQAIVLDASYPLPYRMLGVLYAHSGRHEEARPAIRRARELDPLVAVYQALSAQVAFVARDFIAAKQFARQSIVIDPEFWIGHLQLAQTCEQLGENEQALEALHEASRLSNGNSKAMALRGYIFAKLGRKDEAAEVLTMLAALSRERFVPPYALALVHAGLGQKDFAMEWLERAWAARDVHLTFLPVDPKWDVFRAEPRFAALLSRCEFMAPHDEARGSNTATFRA
jgi:DNA-binding winged helix-turn-helix (wHTH) protein/tetratricopeptide (TPR) repeat protein